VATYKLIQDIEAEDKILGPLTLRQFIFALIALFFFYICFIGATKSMPFLLAIFLPPALFFAFFAVPFGRDQPTEIWALAKLRFWFKPRTRIWNQSGVKESVTITVPKKIELVLTDGLSQTEVKSRLHALAATIDSRGWAIKNVNTFGPPPTTADPNRLIDIGSLPQEVPADDITNSDDIMDNYNNPIAQQFDSMITQSSRTHRKQLVDKLNDVRDSQAMPPDAANGRWFMAQAASPAPVRPAVPGKAAAPAVPASSYEDTLSLELKNRAGSRQAAYGNLRTMQPLAAQPAPAVNPPTAAPTTPPSDPAIISLANNNDLNVATLAREAQKAKGEDRELPPDEVVISLR
jgi:hypothetical protein